VLHWRPVAPRIPSGNRGLMKSAASGAAVLRLRPSRSIGLRPYVFLLQSRLVLAPGVIPGLGRGGVESVQLRHLLAAVVHSAQQSGNRAYARTSHLQRRGRR